MKDIESIFGKAIGEVERMLNTKTVVGEPITVDGNTLIPLLSVGFGFGVGGGEGNDPKKGPGTGGGVGCGGGVKPIAVVVINKDGVRIESVKAGAGSLVEKIADAAAKFATAKSTPAS
ncbi:MAG TPA: spore germination protein GerW family protein [Burkholderiaceae bacterium]|nr:spore germination protein GerW family protein [Burkholderiaceae bacterium]